MFEEHYGEVLSGIMLRAALARAKMRNEVELRRFLESDSQGVGSLDIFGPATPELAPLGGVRNSRNLRLHGIKMTKI